MLVTGCAVAGSPSAARTPTRAASEAAVVAPAPTPTAAPAPAPPIAPGALRADDAALSLDGHPYRPVGLDVYQLATRWGQNMGCGGMFEDAQLDTFFASLPPRTLVRFWAWQGAMATNHETNQRDWRPLDRVMAAAERHGIVLIVSLGSQHGNCDDGRWKDVAWYEGGYRDLGTGDGYSKAIVPYPDYVREIVTRYRTSPAVGMWEPINEPEASTCGPGLAMSHCYDDLTCPDPARSTAALRSFFDGIGALIRSIDADHLIESGSIGGGQCGWAGSGFGTIGASAGIDVTSFHAYAGSVSDLRELGDRVATSDALGKPLVVGEMGLPAGATGGCASRTDRTRVMRESVDAMFGLGVDGIALWNYGLDVAPGCSYDIGPVDPVLGLLHGAG